MFSASEIGSSSSFDSNNKETPRGGVSLLLFCAAGRLCHCFDSFDALILAGEVVLPPQGVKATAGSIE